MTLFIRVKETKSGGFTIIVMQGRSTPSWKLASFNASNTQHRDDILTGLMAYAIRLKLDVKKNLN
jgi:hypothetical protein